MTKKSFKDLTIVSVTGSSDYIQGSIYAIQRSCEELKGARGLLISPPLPSHIIIPPEIEHQVISPFGYLEYNLFILYQLDCFIHTDYCLLVQNDGWVINGRNWKEEFWDYDYIGGPIPSYYQYNNEILIQQNTEFYFNHPELLNDPTWMEPQNGGFSLRSKRLLGILRKLNIPYMITPPKQGNPYNFEWDMLTHHEDIYLSVVLRQNLIDHGIKFAPSQLACYFSMESSSVQARRNISFNELLGFHFFGNVKLIELNKVEIKIKNSPSNFPIDKYIEIIESWDGYKMFRFSGYDIHIIVP